MTDRTEVEACAGVTVALGGTPTANTAARAAAWSRSIEFLAEHLGA